MLDTRIQWMFNKSRIRRSEAEEHYYELVISASHAELKKTREEILSSAIEEFKSVFSGRACRRSVVHAGVLKEARATFSVTPGLERFRPEADSLWGWTLSGRGLDAHGLAEHDGKRGAKRADGSGGGGEGCGFRPGGF